MNRVWRHDLIWAGFMLGVAACIGLVQQWPMVRQAWRGELAAKIEEVRAERRQELYKGIKTVNLTQAYALFQQGQALFIDARKPDEYAELHIPQARNIQPSLLERQGGEAMAGIAKDREIVVYCDQESCDLSLKVAERLQALGFTRVQVFLGGFRAWDEAGYPADTSK